MPPSDAPITCPSCGYHAGQAAAAHLLYTDEQLRADRLRQEVSRLTAELRATKRELSAAREDRDISDRRVERLMAAKEAV